MAEGMTVAELAEVVGMSPRNIRAHQSKGLLFPPHIEGRVARYSEAHVARLRLVSSLQREGFTLAAIKRMIEPPTATPRSSPTGAAGSATAARTSPTTVPIPEELIRHLLPSLPEDLTETGLAWRDPDGRLVSHTVLVAVGRHAVDAGGAAQGHRHLQLEAAAAARRLGELLRDRLLEHVEDEARHGDLARVAVQLAATAFEIGFLEAAIGTAAAESPERSDDTG